MSHEWLRDSRLFLLLLSIDLEWAAATQAARCPGCGGRLDAAHYPRKPRGGPPPELREKYGRRLSFCCDAEGCRKRSTPPSVRFLGPRVYLGAVVVLVSAMLRGVTDKRLVELRERLDSPTLAKSTLARWRTWWRSEMPASPFWQDARSRFAVPVDEADLPAALLARFEGGSEHVLAAALRFVSPLSTRLRAASG